MTMTESRSRIWAREVEKRRVDNRVVSLQSQLEESERRNLRLSKELLDETTLRVRLEKKQDDLSEQMEDLRNDLEEAEKRLDERIGRPKKIERHRLSTGKDRKVPESTGVPPSTRKKIEGTDTVVTDVGGDPSQRGHKTSSRKRGIVK